MGLDDGGPRRANEEDALERLVREQNAADGEEEDEGEPEWADADVNEPIVMSAPTGSSETKRNLLFEVRVNNGAVLYSCPRTQNSRPLLRLALPCGVSSSL
jgi:hypothetical protein